MLLLSWSITRRSLGLPVERRLRLTMRGPVLFFSSFPLSPHLPRSLSYIMVHFPLASRAHWTIRVDRLNLQGATLHQILCACNPRRRCCAPSRRAGPAAVGVGKSNTGCAAVVCCWPSRRAPRGDKARRPEPTPPHCCYPWHQSSLSPHVEHSLPHALPLPLHVDLAGLFLAALLGIPNTSTPRRRLLPCPRTLPFAKAPASLSHASPRPPAHRCS